MAIQSVESGLWTPQAPPQPARELLWQPGAPDVDEAVGATLDMLTMLGGVNDANKEAVQEEVQGSFAELAGLGYDGRLRVVPSPENVSTTALMSAAEDLRPQGVAEMWRWPNLWEPGTEAESYTEADLNGSQTAVLAQLAIFSSKETGVDRTLHHLSLPYDKFAKEKWNPDIETTQLEAVAADKVEAEARHEGFELTMTDHRGYLVDAIMARILGVDPSSAEFPLNSGFMRMPEDMRRRTVDGVSVVGLVGSAQGRLAFAGASGFAHSDGGVGVSMGQKTVDAA